MFQRKEAPAPRPVLTPGLHGAVSPDHDGPELRALLAAPDAFFERPDTTVIKDSRRSMVARGWLDAAEVVVKRTHPHSTLKALKRAFAPSRAARSWHAGRRLRALGIDTPAPVAYVERRLGPFRGRSWLVMERVPGVDALTFFREHPLPEDRRPAVERIATLLARLHDAGISHGDNNVRNFVVDGDRAYVLDLDRLFFHRRWSLLRRRYIRRDLKGLLANWLRDPVVHGQLREALLRRGASGRCRR